MSRTNNAIRNIIWGLFYKFVTLILPFINRTVMIYTLGLKYVGLGSLFSSILQVLSFAELGVGSALVYSMYKPLADGNHEKVSALLKLYKETYRIIGVIVFAFGLIMMPFLKYIIAADIPENVNLQVLFSIYLINNVVGYFLFSHQQSLLIAAQRIDITSKIGMSMQLVLGFTQVIILLTLENYYFYAIVFPIITLISNCATAIISKIVFPNYKCQGDIDLSEKKEIKKKVTGMISQKIGGIILSSADTIIISSFLGLVPLALFQNYYLIITSLFGVLTVITQSIIAGVGNSIVTDSVEKNHRDFKRFNFIYTWIVGWFSICLACLYTPFMNLWVGKENTLSTGMTILFAMYFFIHKWCDILYVFQEACGIWWETRYIPLAAAVCNLIVNILLVQKIGLPGILISTIIAVLAIYDTGYASVLFRTYFDKIDQGLSLYWKRQIIYFITVICAASITFKICSFVTTKNNFFQLIVNALICVVIPNVCFWCVWRKFEEYDYAKSIVVNMYMRLKNDV